MKNIILKIFVAKFFQIFFLRRSKKKSPNAPKTSKTRKTRFLRFRKFWNFGSRFLNFSICYHLWARNKKSIIIRFFWNFFYVFRSLWTFRKVYGLPMTKFFNISKNRFEVFQISDFRGFRRPSSYISQNTPWSGSTYRGDGFLRQGFQNAPSARL